MNLYDKLFLLRHLPRLKFSVNKHGANLKLRLRWRAATGKELWTTVQVTPDGAVLAPFPWPLNEYDVRNLIEGKAVDAFYGTFEVA